MEINYQSLFKQYLKHSDNLFILLSDLLIIIDINPSAKKILGWIKKDVRNQFIGDIFKKYDTIPFIETNILPKKSVITTEIKKNHTVLTIKWNIIPTISADKNKVIFILGEVSNRLSTDKMENIQLNNIVKYAPGLVYWKDTNSVYQGCNEEFARLAGLKSSEQVKGKTDYDLIWKEGAALYIAGDQKVLKTGNPNLNIEEVVATADHNKITVISNKVPLLDNQGRVIGIMGITTDITHQKKIENELSIAKEAAEAASYAKTEFIANMSHDIRTPLTGVIGLSEILENALNDPVQKEEAHMLHDSGEELLSMLNGILDDVDAGNMDEEDIHFEIFDLHQCINDLIKLERPTTTLKHLDLYVDIPKEIPKYIKNDRKKIHRILLNLLGNAIKFTQSGHITIQVICLKNVGDDIYLQFKVADTGIGIPKELQNKVFDRFYRVTPSYKGIYKGHGLGLHIARSYVELLGGHITLTSKENVGTTFSFDLHSKKVSDLELILKNNPAKNTKKSVPILPKKACLKSPIQNHALRILLVEDNATALKVLKSIVTRAGYGFTSAIDGEQALKLVTSTPFDLIITDIGLPGISGNALSRQIRQFEKKSNKNAVPIVGLTGHTKESDHVECIKSGMNDVFTKPISVETIQSIVHQYVLKDSDKMKDSTRLAPESLGPGLPNTEQALFELEHLPIFDIQMALETIPDHALLFKLLNEFITDEGQRDILQLQEAYINKDWERVESLAHKFKGGAVYLGIPRLQFACQYLERYYKAGYKTQLEPLYQQLISTNQTTIKAVTDWLIKQK